MDEANELSDELKLLIAAANRAATIKPESPVGSCSTMNLAKI